MKEKMDKAKTIETQDHMIKGFNLKQLRQPLLVLKLTMVIKCMATMNVQKKLMKRKKNLKMMGDFMKKRKNKVITVINKVGTNRIHQLIIAHLITQIVIISHSIILIAIIDNTNNKTSNINTDRTQMYDLM